MAETPMPPSAERPMTRVCIEIQRADVQVDARARWQAYAANIDGFGDPTLDARNRQLGA